MERAFTLVEVLVVVALIGILSGMAAMRYQRFTAINNLEQAANDLKSDLEWVKLRADKTRIKHYLAFTVSGTERGWTIWMENTGNLTYNYGSDSLIRTTVLPAKVTFTRPTWASALNGPSEASDSTWPATGLATGVGGTCSNSTTATYNWYSVIGICPDVITTIEHGTAYLASNDQNVREAYAVVYNDAKNLNPTLWKYNGSSWSKP